MQCYRYAGINDPLETSVVAVQVWSTNLTIVLLLGRYGHSCVVAMLLCRYGHSMLLLCRYGHSSVVAMQVLSLYCIPALNIAQSVKIVRSHKTVQVSGIIWH
ncbi:hypothetical protein DPMN_013902 [Dreissena polymorpha]|uniref:Uncharacterized protein n=1 Tax=Dreissena polymorpha TaxID=45954 RepID=A0A9D4N513_DREPO|nr:hypothetical protein DPMN_013902 [Dreissena polymorpha]